MLISKEEFLEKMKNQFFSVEVNLTGVSMWECEAILTDFLGDTELFDRRGRDWNLYRNSRILPVVCSDWEGTEPVLEYFQAQLITPVLEYDDIPMLLEILRRIKMAGGISDIGHQCEVHVHVKVEVEQNEILYDLIQGMSKKKYLLEKALQIPECRRLCFSVYEADGLGNPILRLSEEFCKSGVEFCLYNGTLDADRMLCYVQLSLALTESACYLKNRLFHEPDWFVNEKHCMNHWLANMHLSGREFQTLRRVMLENLSAESPSHDLKGNADTTLFMDLTGKYMPDDFTEEELPRT